MAAKEVWRDIPGFGEKYQVSSLGRVRNHASGKVLARRLHRDFYAKVNLKVRRTFSRTFHVHTLVAEAFLGPRPEGFVIDHIDGNHENDAAKNLRYLSPSDSNMNRKLRGESRQSTGVPCVYRHAYGGFYARGYHGGKKFRLGYFKDIAAAERAVKKFKASAPKTSRARPAGLRAIQG